MIPRMQHTKTKACKRIERIMRERNLSQRSLAKLLSVSPVTIHQWLSGKARPSAYLRRAIERMFDIPEQDWDTQPEREHYAHIFKRKT
jgi:transcriptional regulator with XRE-family HTH domain